MIRFLKGLVLLPVAILVVAFAVANRDGSTLILAQDLGPTREVLADAGLPWAVPAPLSAVQPCAWFCAISLG